MRVQMLLLTAILLVGAGSVSVTAFYLSPNKEIALFGNPVARRQTSVPSGAVVAGASEQRAILPRNIPFLADCEILSFLKSETHYQLVCQTADSLFLTAKRFGEVAVAKQWRLGQTRLRNGVYRLSAERRSQKLEAKFARDEQQARTVVTVLLTRPSSN